MASVTLVLSATLGWIAYCVAVVFSADLQAKIAGGAVSLAVMAALAILGRTLDGRPSWLELIRSIAFWTTRHPWLGSGVMVLCGLASVAAGFLGPRSTYVFRVLCNEATSIQLPGDSFPCSASAVIRRWSPLALPRADLYECVWTTLVPNPKAAALLDVAGGTLTCPARARPPAAATEPVRPSAPLAPAAAPPPDAPVRRKTRPRAPEAPAKVAGVPQVAPALDCGVVAREVAELEREIKHLGSCFRSDLGMPADLDTCAVRKKTLHGKLEDAQRTQRVHCP